MNLLSFISAAFTKTNIPPFRTRSTKVQLSLFNSWNQFYSSSEYEIVNQNSFNEKRNDFYESPKNYYLQNIEVQDLTTNAIFIQKKDKISTLIEQCKFINVITNIPTQKSTGAIFYDSFDGDCIINKCTAYKCYNKIKNSNAYYDGGQFATLWHSRNQIIISSIVSCADQPYGVSPFKSKDTSGKYTGINISKCQTNDSALFAVFPSNSDYIKFSLFDGNYGELKVSTGIYVFYNGKFAIRQCIFTNNSVFTLIFTTHNVAAEIEECIFSNNKNDFLSYAFKGKDNTGHHYSKISIKNCYFEDTSTKYAVTGSASVSFDNKNNKSIKDHVKSQVNEALHPTIIIYSKEVPYYLKNRKIHVHH